MPETTTTAAEAFNKILDAFAKMATEPPLEPVSEPVSATAAPRRRLPYKAAKAEWKRN